MRKDRRMVLAGLAAGAAGAGGWLWWARGGGLPGGEPRGPYAAWEAWRGPQDEPVRNLVRAAILASNPNNSQPWLFRLAPDRIEVLADSNRAAGPLDPYLREIHMGLGCAIENMALAAPANGLTIQARYSQGRLGPNMPSGLVAGAAAILSLSRQPGTPPAVLNEIPRRHTNRGPFEKGRAVPADALAAFERMAEAEDGEVKIVWLQEPERRTRFGVLSVQACRVVLKHPTLVAAWHKWLRPADSAKESRDGIPIETSLQDAGPAWVEATQMQVDTAPMIGVVMLRDPYHLAAVVRAGRVWQRIHVEAVRRGLAAQPLNQVLWRMEYEENLSGSSPFAPTVYELLATPEWRPTHFFRLGYAKSEAPAIPRRSIDAVVLATS